MAGSSRPRRAIVPGRKFCTSTSAPAIKRRAAASAAGCFRSSASERLPRLEDTNIAVNSPSPAVRRAMSPPNGSTLMTSAPWSASSMVQTGPEMTVVRSITRIPASGPSILPALQPGPRVEFVRPRIARLFVQKPIIVRDRLRVEDATAIPPGRVTLRGARARELGVDGAVDHDMRDMDAFGARFARHALSQSRQCVFAPGERGVTRRAADTRGSVGEQDRAALARHHACRRLASVQEPGEGAHLPHFGINARGGFADREADVAANIEDQHFYRADFALDGGEQGGDIIFAAGVTAEGMSFATGRFDLSHQRVQPGPRPAREAHDVALTGEAAGDRTTRGITGTDDQGDFLARHGRPFAWSTSDTCGRRPSLSIAALAPKPRRVV